MKTTSIFLLLLVIVSPTSHAVDAGLDARMQEAIRKRDEINAKIKPELEKIETLTKEIKDIARQMDGKPELDAKAKDRLLPTLVEALNTKKNHLQIRRSVKDKNKNGDPALFQYTRPAEGSDSWSADIGAKFSRDIGQIGPGLARLGGLAEYHYDSSQAQLKDVLLTQATLDWLAGSDSNTAQMFTTNVGYKQDNFVAGESYLGSLLWFPYFQQAKIGNRWTGSVLSGRIEPLFGVEYESGNGALGFKDGERLSVRAGVSINVAVLPRYFGNRLENETNFLLWYHSSRSGVFESYDETQTTFSTALTYWFNSNADGDRALSDDERHFGLTARYTRGDHPNEGQFDADVLTLGFSILF